MHIHPHKALEHAAYQCDILSLFVLSQCCSREFIADLSFRVYNHSSHREYKKTALFLLLCLIPRRKGINEQADRNKIPGYMSDVLKNPADLPLILGMYWRNKRLPNCRMFLRGLAKVLCSFTEEQLLETEYYGPVRLKDVISICQPKAKTPEQQKLFDRIINGEILK